MNAAARLGAPLAVLAACGGGEKPTPAATWLAEPLAAVRTSELVAGAADSAPALASPFEDDKAVLAEGRQLYQSFNCGGCHGGAGGGGIGPPLADGKWIYGGSAANIYATIVQGRPNGMPAYGPGLQGEPVWKLAAYVRSLGEEAAKEREHQEQQEQQEQGRGSGR